jgi:hypothetical protein
MWDSSYMEDPEKLDEQAHAWAWRLVNGQLKALGVAIVSAELVWFRNLLFALLKSAILDYRYVERTSKLTDARIMAWGWRNLLELTVITEFVLESEANAIQFQTEVAKDTAEFYAALSEMQRHLHRRILDELTDFGQNLTPDFQARVSQHIDEQREAKTDTSATDFEAAAFREVLRELKVPPKERPIMSSGKDGYADRIGRKKQFDPVFQICSKLIHRTALSISSENVLDSLKEIVPILRCAALSDLLDISGRIKKHIEAHGIRPI